MLVEIGFFGRAPGREEHFVFSRLELPFRKAPGVMGGVAEEEEPRACRLGDIDDVSCGVLHV
jgi:hypothetical protein